MAGGPRPYGDKVNGVITNYPVIHLGYLVYPKSKDVSLVTSQFTPISPTHQTRLNLSCSAKKVSLFHIFRAYRSKRRQAMVSQRDRDLFRDDIRSRGTKLSAAEREKILRPYLPDPADISRRPPQRRKKAPKKTPIRTFLKSQLHQFTYTLIHIFFGLYVRIVQAYHALVDRILAIVYYHHRTPELIQKDVKNLDRLPEHLSVILSMRREDDALAILMDDVAELAAWCMSAGIPVLSVYEKSGKCAVAPYYGTVANQWLRNSEILHPSTLPDDHEQAVIIL